MTQSNTNFPNPFEAMMNIMTQIPAGKMPTMPTMPTMPKMPELADMPDLEELTELSRAGFTAMATSALAAAEGVHKMNAFAYDTAQRNAERAVEAGHAMASVSEVEEATKLHQDFAKTAFQAYMEDTSAAASLFMGTLREAGKPLSDHASTLAKQVQGAA